MSLTQANSPDGNNNEVSADPDIVDIVTDYIRLVEDLWHHRRSAYVEWRKTNSDAQRSIYDHQCFIKYMEETGDMRKLSKQIPIQLPRVESSISVEDLKERSGLENTSTSKSKQLVDFFSKQQEAKTIGYYKKYLKNKSQPSIGTGTSGRPTTPNAQGNTKSQVESKLKTFQTNRVGGPLQTKSILVKPSPNQKRNITRFTNSSNAQSSPAGNQKKDASSLSASKLPSRSPNQGRKYYQAPLPKTASLAVKTTSDNRSKPKPLAVHKVVSKIDSGLGKGIRGRKKAATSSTKTDVKKEEQSKTIMGGKSSIDEEDNCTIRYENDASGNKPLASLEGDPPATPGGQKLGRETEDILQDVSPRSSTPGLKAHVQSSPSFHIGYGTEANQGANENTSRSAITPEDPDYEVIREMAKDYLVQLELEWKSNHSSWLQLTKHSAQIPLECCMYNYETFSEYVRKSAEVESSVPLQIPFEFPELEKKESNPTLEEENCSEIENPTSEAGAMPCPPNEKAGAIEVLIKPMDMSLEEEHHESDGNETPILSDTKFFCDSPPSQVRYQVERTRTVTIHQYQETQLTEKRPSAVYAKRSEPILPLPDFQNAIERQLIARKNGNACNEQREFDQDMDYCVKTYLEWSRETSKTILATHSQERQGEVTSVSIPERTSQNPLAQVPFQLPIPCTSAHGNTDSNQLI